MLAPVVVNVNVAGDLVLVPGKPQTRVRVIGLLLTSPAAGPVLNLTFKSKAGLSGAATLLTGPLVSSTRLFMPFGPLLAGGWQGWFETLDGEDLVLNLDAAVQVGGFVHYIQTR